MCSDIAYICDEKYIIPTLVSIRSVIENFNSELKIHILTIDMPSSVKRKLEVLSSTHVKVIIHDIDQLTFKKKCKDIAMFSHVTPTALLKFDLSEVLKDVDEVLYLDSDVVVKDDITELMSISLDYNYVCAAPDLWKGFYEKQKTDKGKTYFNSGVMLLNLDLFRKEGIAERLWEKKFELLKTGSSKTMDQDTLNNVLGTKLLLLPIEYNFNPYFIQDKLLNIVNEYLKTPVDDINELIDRIRIIHYVGKEDKPWIYKTARLCWVWDRIYSELGFDINALDRKSIRQGLPHKIQSVVSLFKREGIVKTITAIIVELKR